MRLICAAVEPKLPSSALVFTAAYTRPDESDCRDFRLMWSSACLVPWTATDPRHWSAAWPSMWTAQYMVWSIWLLHMTPTLLLPYATTAEMSSGAGLEPETGRMNGVPHVASLAPMLLLT